MIVLPDLSDTKSRSRFRGEMGSGFRVFEEDAVQSSSVLTSEDAVQSSSVLTSEDTVQSSSVLTSPVSLSHHFVLLFFCFLGYNLEYIQLSLSNKNACG